MFCTRCGAKLDDNARFCSQCGAPVAHRNPEPQNNIPSSTDTPSAPNAVRGDLPVGMTRSPDGKIWWSFRTKKEEHLCCMSDEGLVCYDEAPEQQKTSAFKSILLETADWTAMGSDNYPYAEFPSELFGEEGASNRVRINGKEFFRWPSSFRYMSAIKEDRKNLTLKLYAENIPIKYHFTPEQYDYALNFILAHRSNIKRK